MDRYTEFVTNHWMLFIALLVVIYLLLQELIEGAFKKYKTLSPILAVAQMNKEDMIILDVREPVEFNNGHISDAINTPIEKLTDFIAKMESQKKHPILVVCQTGTRSTPASKKLSKLGFEKIYTLEGGMQSWEENKLPTIKMAN